MEELRTGEPGLPRTDQDLLRIHVLCRMFGSEELARLVDLANQLDEDAKRSPESITIAGLVTVHIIPESLEGGGAYAFVFLLLGLAFPVVLQ